MSRIQQEKDFHNARFGIEDDFRKGLDKYYSIAKSSRKFFHDLYQMNNIDKRVLEYGCGTGNNSIQLAKACKTITGIDISDKAIEKANQAIPDDVQNVKFHVMDAENLEFPDYSFDLIFGSGILHHLKLEKAYAELSRILAENGTAVFFEPLGHNPIINMYRKFTPKLRTDDEHPLLVQNLKLAEKYFKVVDITYFHLTSFCAIPLRNSRFFDKTLGFFEYFDKALLYLIPPLKRFAWIVVIRLSN